MRRLSMRLAVVSGGVLALSLLASGCGSASGTAANSTATTPASPAVRHYKRRYVTIAGKRILVPTERGDVPIQPAEDDGLQVIITPKGFEPHLLFAVDDRAVTFTNLTGEPQRLRFLNAPGGSPSIAPGGTWRFTSNHAQSYVYVNQSHWRGELFCAPDVPDVP